MTQIKLTNEHKKLLKGMAHHLDPVITVGDKGLSDSLLEEAEKTIAHHELIKVKIAEGDREERETIINELVTALDAQLITKIGRMAIIFKRNHEAPKISFK